jgi:D-3-phosphoglycerate dehydrogenase
LTETRSDETHDYLSLIRLTGWFDGESIQLSGTLLGDCHPRLVSIDDFEVEVVPEGTLLITPHDDQPGVIAALAGILSEARINISRMQVGSQEEGRTAMAVIGISETLDDGLLAALNNVPSVHNVAQIQL